MAMLEEFPTFEGGMESRNACIARPFELHAKWQTLSAESGMVRSSPASRPPFPLPFLNLPGIFCGRLRRYTAQIN